MTARKPPNPDTPNTTVRPYRKKRGARATPEGVLERAMQARAATDTSSYEGAMSVSPDKPLTEKQRAFVKFWAQGESITSASIKAGYADNGTLAYRLVRMPNVLRLYEAEKAKYEEAAQMTRKKVMDGFLEAVEMAKMLAEPATMVSGWREIAKMCGYMAPVESKVSINISGNIALERLERMSDADLLKMITAPIEQAEQSSGDDE